MFQHFTKEQHDSAMEYRDHSKNGASLKSLRVGLNLNKLLVAVVLLCFCTFTNSMAQTWQIGSPTAANVTATLNNGTLTITGTGAMRDFGNNTSMPWYTVKNNITSVIINNGVTTIGSCAFEAHTNLSSVTIPSSISSTGTWAFVGCTKLTSITLPSSITSISQESFRDCRNLTTINFNNPTPPSIGYLSFGGVNQSSCSVYVPSGSYSAYSNAGFSNFNIIEKDKWLVLCVVFTNVQTCVSNTISDAQFEEIRNSYIADFEKFVKNAVPKLDLKITVIQHKNLINGSNAEVGYYTLPPNSNMISILNGYNYQSYDGVITLADLTPTENAGCGVGVGWSWSALRYGTVMLIPQIFSYDWWVECIVHEWMHGLEWWFASLGYTVPNLHDAGSYQFEGNWLHAYLSNALTGGIATGIHPDWWKYSPTSKLNSIDEIVANQVSIFPNPTKDDIFIKSELLIERVEIYSLTGALMILENKFSERISVSALPQGIYLLKIHTDKGLITRKIMKE